MTGARADFRFKVATGISPEGVIKQSVEDPWGNIITRVMDLQEEGIKQALRDLGWIEPARARVSPATMPGGMCMAPGCGRALVYDKGPRGADDGEWTCPATPEQHRMAELEDVLSSARAIAERGGIDTAWERFAARIASLGIGSVTAKVFKVLRSDPPAQDLGQDLRTAIEILRALTTNPSLNLGDRVYDVREREGLGWEGPDVKAWSDAVTRAEAFLKEHP